MNYDVKNIDLYKTISTVALLSMVFLLLWFFYRSSVSSLGHGDYIDEFTIQCEASGGGVSLTKDNNGWPQPECRKNGILLNIKKSRYG